MNGRSENSASEAVASIAMHAACDRLPTLFISAVAFRPVVVA